MGPTNVALVKLFQADTKYRQAQSRYEAASRDVKIQQRRLDELQARLDATNLQLREQQVRSSNTDLDIKAREERIDKLRQQQQTAKNNKEYQNFLIQINTEKVDKSKVEDEMIKAMSSVETLQAESTQLALQVEAEKQKLQAMKERITEKLTAIQGEIDQLKPGRDTAAQGVQPDLLQSYEKLAERFEGEAMASIIKPDDRVEEYACGACNMSLVVDLYNRLHTRDEPLYCPSCRRLLYIPESLTPETALNNNKKKPAKKGGKGKKGADAENTEADQAPAQPHPEPSAA